MYIKDPREIENTSMDIIDRHMGDTNFTNDELVVAKRMIHTTGDFDYRHIIIFKNDFIKKARESLSKGPRIYTDTKMTRMGINQEALNKVSGSLVTYIGEEEARLRALDQGTTRSACAMDMAIEDGIKAFVIGNAPTALFRLLEAVENGLVDPDFIIGVPVGFVGAKESKEYLRTFPIPSISTRGYKGGSNVAASIVNALLYMEVGR